MIGGHIIEQAQQQTATGTSHNTRLKSALADVEAKLATAQNDTDLVAAIELLKEFPAPVAFDNKRLNLITVGICAAAIITGLGTWQFGLAPILIPIAAASGIIALIAYGIIRFSRGHSMDNLSDRIHHKTVLHDYGLKPLNFDPKAKARSLGRRYRAFQLGNYSREMKSMLEGTYNGSEHTYEYQYFHFHYVNQRTETYTTTDSKGNVKVRTRTVYDHFDRYGFLLHFPFVRSMRISEKVLGWFSSGWKSSSTEFNKRFNVAAASEMDAAKFLKPKIVVELEAAAEALRNLDLEFTDSGDLCFSFDDANTLAAGRRHGIETPSAFAKEIAGHSTQPNLEAGLKFIHTLMKYSDNNFS